MIPHLANEENDVTWVLTVPAIWDEPAKQFMEEAAAKVSSALNPICTLLEKKSIFQSFKCLALMLQFLLFSKYVKISFFMSIY